MTRISFNGHHVAYFERQMHVVFIKATTGVLEGHFHNVEIIEIAGNIFKPITTAQFASRAGIITTTGHDLSFAFFRASCLFVIFVIVAHHHLAKLTARVSRITVMRTCPG